MSSGPYKLLSHFFAMCLLGTAGCSVLPEVSHQPLLHNPFPQLSRVAVAPFFNQSDEPTVDGRAFAMAYYAELQDIPGFEVVPVNVVEQVIIGAGIDLSGPGEARRLAQLLGVDAVVVGAVTDYSIYYPPRCGLRVEWYAANPGFHEIPAGYGLPWGTPLEEFIPDSLVFEAELALAREQLKTQTPVASPQATSLPAPPPVELGPPNAFQGADGPSRPIDPNSPVEILPAPPGEPGASSIPVTESLPAAPIEPTQHREPASSLMPAPGATVGIDTTGAIVPPGPGEIFPPDWPDARGFTPPGPSPVRPPLSPHNGPVMTHTRVFRGHDPEFTSALASYVGFRDDARFSGWQSYLSRSDDFIRFCAHLHLAEMLTARGGGGETRVVSRRPSRR